MNSKRIARFVLAFFLAWHASVVLAAETDPLKIKWMSNEDMLEQISSTPVSLPPDFPARLQEYYKTLPPIIVPPGADHARNQKLAESERSRRWKPLLDRASKGSEGWKLKDLSAVTSARDAELAWVFAVLATNGDPTVQFFGLVPQVGVLKDPEAAAKLSALGKRTDLSDKDKWKLQNYFHGIGIDPVVDDEKEILRFLTAIDNEELRLKPGTPAPDFEIETPEGRKIRLSDFKGKVVLLHFWATTCPPCLAEFPRLEMDLRDWRQLNPDFIVMGIALDDNWNEVHKVLKKYRFEWITASDGRGWGGEAAKRYYIRAIPSDVVIDKNGNVAGYGRASLQSLLKPEESASIQGKP